MSCWNFRAWINEAAEIQERNAAAIDLAERMFSSWIGRPLDEWLFKSDLSGDVLGLAYGLNFQACRQFRSAE